MPNRIIREALITSEKINKLTPQEESFFVRLMLRADDFGRYYANPKLLKSGLYPLRDNIRDTDMIRWLAACQKADLLHCYEVDGKRYIEVYDFGQRVRSAKSKFPAPNEGNPSFADNCQQMSDTCLTDGSNCPPNSYSYSEAHSESKTESEAYSCPEPAPQASGLDEEAILVFPCKGTGKKSWPLMEAKIAEWAEAFPAIDVLSECRKARQWLIDHPDRQKTYAGMLKYLNGWLSRSQDSAKSNAGNASGKATAPSFTESVGELMEWARRRELEVGDA